MAVLLVSGCQWKNKPNLKNAKQSKKKELFYSEESPLKAYSYLYTSETHRKIWAWHLALWRETGQRRILVLAGEQSFSLSGHQDLQAAPHHAEVLFSSLGFRSCNQDFTKCFSCVAFSTLVVVLGVEKSPVQARRAVYYCTTSLALSCTDIYRRVFLLWLVDVRDYPDFWLNSSA